MKPLSKAIKSANVEGRSWKQELYSLLRSYRATPHVAAGKSPAELLFGQNIKIMLPEFRSEKNDKELRKRNKEKKEKIKTFADKRNVNRIPHSFKPGDMVLMKQPSQNKLRTCYNKIPTQVVKVKGNMVSTFHPKLGFKTQKCVYVQNNLCSK